MTSDKLKNILDDWTSSVMSDCEDGYYNDLENTRKISRLMSEISNIGTNKAGMFALIAKAFIEVAPYISRVQIIVSHSSLLKELYIVQPHRSNEDKQLAVSLFDKAIEAQTSVTKLKSLVNATGYYRDIIAANFDDFPIESLKPYFMSARELSCAFKYATDIAGKTIYPKSLFRNNDGNAWVNLVYNQSLVALIKSSFEDGFESIYPINMHGGCFASKPLDDLMARFKMLNEAGIKIVPRQADLVVISRVVQRLCEVIQVEMNPQRASMLSDAIVDFLTIVRPESGKKYKASDNIFSEKESAKWLKGGAFVLSDLRDSIKSTPENVGSDEARMAISRFHLEVIMQSFEAHYRMKKYSDIDIKRILTSEIIDKGHLALHQPKPLGKMNKFPMIDFIVSLPAGDIKLELMAQYQESSRAVLMNDLGM